MGKYTLGISTLLLATSSTLCAGDYPPSVQGKEATGLVNPSSRFQVDNGWNLFLDTEFLWWVAKEDGLYYAQNKFTNEETTAVPPDGTVDFNGHIERVHPHWHPGFRIGFGGNMSYDEWDILLNWTWFRSHSHTERKGLLLVLWGHPDQTTTKGATRAEGNWKLHYNVLDVEMGRAFWVGRHFSLHPFFGIRGAWIDQHFKIHYDYTTTPVTKGRLKAKSDFEGVGVRAGFDARFTLIGGWSFYGIASAAMLYGHYDCDFREKWNRVRIATSRDGFHQAASTAQLALGVRWDGYIYRDRYHFGLYAGWEQNIWFSVNKMNHYFSGLGDGDLQQMNSDLTLQGGTFGIRFDF
ncbi:MAG: Lpg1974 family pore-forming outer membrane protein [Rhabdochlamydiaceae bacterium]|jgi:hypothetical protein